MSSRLTRLMGVLWILLNVGACAHMADMSPPNEEKLMQSVQKAWEAKKNKDWGTVYDMAAEAYQKTVKRDEFIQRSNIQIADFSIKEVKMPESGNEAQAVVDYTIVQMGFKFNNTTKEKWLWEGGEWRLALHRASAKSLFQSSPPAK